MALSSCCGAACDEILACTNFVVSMKRSAQCCCGAGSVSGAAGRRSAAAGRGSPGSPARRPTAASRACLQAAAATCGRKKGCLQGAAGGSSAGREQRTADAELEAVLRDARDEVADLRLLLLLHGELLRRAQRRRERGARAEREPAGYLQISHLLLLRRVHLLPAVHRRRGPARAAAVSCRRAGRRLQQEGCLSGGSGVNTATAAAIDSHQSSPIADCCSNCKGAVPGERPMIQKVPAQVWRQITSAPAAAAAHATHMLHSLPVQVPVLPVDR